MGHPVFTLEQWVDFDLAYAKSPQQLKGIYILDCNTAASVMYLEMIQCSNPED